MNEFAHVSVLLKESVLALVTKNDGVYVDCTMGGGGHGAEITAQLSEKGWYIGVDQDPDAIRHAGEKLKNSSCKVSFVQENFSNLKNILKNLDIKRVDGVLFDLGVSSYQLDTAERGFSYMHDGPLDMRMNPLQSQSAYDIVNFYSASELTDILTKYGEEKWAKRIAQFIVAARENKRIDTTSELVQIIKQAIPASARREGPHPAKRTFQAIRIVVNDELGILEDTFHQAIEHLNPGGRICIITFHSLEDRIAKQLLQNAARSCVCPPRIPMCICGKKAEVRIIGKVISPSIDEVDNNPRARSAKLRVAEKI